MASQTHTVNGVRVLELEPSGQPFASERDAVNLVGQAAANNAEMVALPAERLGTSFFELRTRVAGEMIQKFNLYGIRLAIVGDVSAAIQNSAAFRDLVRECNRGTAIWFVANIEELKHRLLS